ncbi:MAG: hypothetical protein J6B64_03120 [Bacilli bacterium]|nr:hypothetical protein [Bacilli bacterium]MBO5376373.1 hypothetical protein [Bacilli bacterium]MBP3597624.1 hypothetical protein [Clostridia bacterium]
MKENCNKIYAVCYDTLDVFNTKEEAKKFYSECYYMSEGAERDRYASVLIGLNFCNIGKDNVSEDCREIAIKIPNIEDEFIKVKLDERLSIEDTIKYYEEIIYPILSVSKSYRIDFNNNSPFEDFGNDNDSQFGSMYSFSNYYQEILEQMNIVVDNISTSDWSAGKYNLIINNEEFKLTAWDNLESVVDNINSMLDLFREKDKIDYKDSNMTQEGEIEI